MEIIKKSKLKQLKACRRACQRIYEAMTVVAEDDHGNVTPFRWDHIHKDILAALADAGYGKVHKKIVGIDEWEYDFPWEWEIRK